MKKVLVTVTLLFMLIILINQQVLASNSIADSIIVVEYSEDFKKWLELTDEEKEKVLQPKMYDVPNTKTEYKNPLLKAKMLRSTLSQNYSLRDTIANNVVVKNQQDTGSCWAFASLSSLETNLALQNHNKGINTSKVYDFSERHMEYATTKNFANSEVNKNGYNRNVGDGGSFYLSASYLMNGQGAVNETDMPFENNENTINLSEINKTVVSQLYDTKEFPSYSKTDDKSEVKRHIQNYGSVYAGIHGAALSSEDCYNNETGAIYCDNSIIYPINHAVSIIGWDDNYSVENFNEGKRPTSNGAWIIKNSWGEKFEYNLAELKQQIFATYEQQCISLGWSDATHIPNEILEQNGYIIDGEKAYIKIGDNGIMYVSYEDVNVHKTLWGIIKSSDTLNYENIYQYDTLFPARLLNYTTSSKIMLANNFSKKTSGKEYLTQVSLYAPETYTCRVYVNPNGTSKAKNDLQLVNLEAGETETFDAGYHTLEFAQPIELKSNDFTVVVEITGTRSGLYIPLETTLDVEPGFDTVKVESGKCYYAGGHDLTQAQWNDFGHIKEENPSLPNGDSTIKAYTVSHIVDNSLRNIEITTPPTKTAYFEGENFDATGMIVTANYNNETSNILDNTSYSISNGNNLQLNQTSVTITYEDKHVDQAITVEKNVVTNLSIKTPPTKTEYKEGQNFDKTGMVIEATRKNGDKEIVTNYTIENGNNLSSGQTKVTISYEGNTVEQPITVIANPLIEIYIDQAPNKTAYVVGQNFDKTGMVVLGKYQDETISEIIDYTIENGMNLTKNQTSVTINYREKTVIQTITVEEKTITGVTIKTKPTKLTYIQNKEELDLTGGNLTVTYNDETTEDISMLSSEIVVTGFSNENLGKITLVLTYETKTVELEVEIVAELVEEKAENSNLNNAKSNIKGIKAYYFTDNSQKDYALIELEINSIDRYLNNDKLEYYYYLSTKPGEENINDWIKVTEDQISRDKLSFTIDTRDILNYEEISNGSALYLYIKEVAIKGGNQSVAISVAISLETDINIETYVNNEKKEDIESDKAPTNNNNDDTVAKDKIPYTGEKITILIAILLILSIGIILYKKYKELSKYIK